MAEFLPFSAVHYNPQKFPKITELVSPPFDTVDSELKKKLCKEHYNFINLILPDGDDHSKYKISVHKLFGWLLRDVLVVDKVPAFYIHEQNILIDGINHKRLGIIGLLKIEEFGDMVKKHEMTFDKYVEDRYHIQKETQSNLETIFCLYKDQNKEMVQKLRDLVASANPVLELNDPDGRPNKIYRVDEKANNDSIKNFFADKTAYIADGQHRYEAALKYQNEMRQSLGEKYTGKEPFNYIMVDFFNVYDVSIIVQPVNRLVKGVDKNAVDILKGLELTYKIGAINFNDMRMEKMAREKIRALLSDARKKNMKAFGVYFKSVPNRYFFLTLKDPAKSNDLDVSILDQTILKPVMNVDGNNIDNVYYEANDILTFEKIKSGEFDVAFILNPVGVDKVIEASDKNILMPSQSTNFYPKVLSGLTVFSYRYSKF